MAELDALVRGVRAGQRAAIGQAITLVESTSPAHASLATSVLEALFSDAGRSVRLGITGAPGVGKSSFIEALGMELITRGKKVAVLAVDPSSVTSGGSILGDKTRMARLAAEACAYIRPSPSAGSAGGVARRTREAIVVVEAAGYDVVIVETVGVGQSELAVAGMVDTFLVLLLPAGGDELQGIKRGLLEIADLVAVNKADGELLATARRTQAEYTAALRILRGEGAPAVLATSAREGTGVADVWAAVETHRDAALRAGHFEARRKAQRITWLRSLLEEQALGNFYASAAVRAALQRLEPEVEAGRRLPSSAAQEIYAASRA